MLKMGEDWGGSAKFTFNLSIMDELDLTCDLLIRLDFAHH